MVDRRQLLAAGVVGGATLLLPQETAWAWAAAKGRVGTLDPARIRKYVTPLVIPPVMPPIDDHRRSIDRYLIGVRQFRQRVLPPGLPHTTVWGYGSLGWPNTFNFPAFTIEAKVDRPVRVTWVNDLVDRSGRFLPHLLPVDPTLHWANPPGGVAGRDTRPTFTSTPRPYDGPVPIVTHLHGGHSTDDSDGYAEAWYLPAARNIPTGFATVGSFYDEFRAKFAARTGMQWKPGTATFQYANDQRATTEWYHDHVLGITRLNVYAGLAGFYLLRGGKSDLPPGVLPGPAPALGDRPRNRYFEIPMAIQDRSFNADGSLFYPDSRAFFDDFTGPYIPGSDISPIWNPEFFGNAMLVNGRTWPVLEVEPRRYRLRLLNGCNSRFLILKIASNPVAPRPAPASLPFWQIGNDGGFLPAPAQLRQLLMAPAERADVIVDFTGLPQGTELFLINEGPDEPFGGGDFATADPATTGQVMKFVVGGLSSRDESLPPDQLELPWITPLGRADMTRQLSLNEVDSAVLPGVGPRAALLGTVENDMARPLEWDDRIGITEDPKLNTTEIWEFHNFTEDAHPMHIHEVQFEVVNRQPFGPDGFERGPEPWERGTKDVVIAYPGEVTRVKAHFDLAGRYVWHCHILEHEDNEMMRPYQIS